LQKDSTGVDKILRRADKATRQAGRTPHQENASLKPIPPSSSEMSSTAPNTPPAMFIVIDCPVV